MKGIVFDDGGVFWWDKEESAENVLYRIYMNGELVAETEKTHFGAKELIPDSEYILTAETVGADGCIAKRENFKFRTKRRKRRIDVTAAPYFAAGDGKTLNTTALQKALDDCTKDCAVYFPAGIYLSGALRVHSDTEIIIGENAVLQGAEDPCDYLPKIKSRFEGIERMCYASLLNIGALCRDKGAVCRNVAIRGGGAVSGGGRVLAENIIARERTLYNAGECSPPEGETPEDSFGRARGRLINISNAENVCIGDLKLTGGPSWNVHMVYSSGIVTYNCKFFSEGVHNGDGWDPDSSKNCTIFGCTFETGDEADTYIVLDLDGVNVSMSVAEGTLPEGMSLSADGRISGTATKAGTYTFTVAAEATNTTAQTTTTYYYTCTITVTGEDYVVNNVTKVELVEGDIVVTYTDGTTTTIDLPEAEQAGKTVENVTINETGDTITVTYTDGTTSTLAISAPAAEESGCGSAVNGLIGFAIAVPVIAVAAVVINRKRTNK